MKSQDDQTPNVEPNFSPSPSGMQRSPLTGVRPAIRRMHGYIPGEQPQDKRYIKLNSNENPYPPSSRVLEELHQAIGADLSLYPDPVANRLRDIAATRYGFHRDNILVGNGSDDLLTMLMRTFVDIGDKVAFPTPTYSLYDVLIAMQAGTAVHVPYPATFSIPPALAEVDAKLTFLCHPNAPTGVLHPMAQIEELAQKVRGVLVIDEAYIDFADETALALVHRYPHVVVLRSFSKSFSLAGMRIGLAFAHPDVIKELLKVKDSYNVDRLSIVAAAAALEDYDWMRQNVEKIRATRGRLMTELRGFGYFVYESQTNFVLARKVGENQAGIYQELRNHGFLVRYFSAPELSDCLRITVGTDAQIDQLLEAMHKVRQGA